MKMSFAASVVLASIFCLGANSARAQVIFQKYSPYHHVQVIDQAGVRLLSFNGTQETRMSKKDPLQGHFEYTEFFHTPWLWNRNMKRVLMIGLGGGSTQRSFLHYYTNTIVDTVEIDPVVVEVAKQFFGVTESARHKIYNEDGRVFLRRATEQYDAILLDAYTTTRYGSSIPPHLTTREFFQLAESRLTTNGVLAYNVIGQVQGWKADIVGGMYRTMSEAFTNVYLFPATSSLNVVLVGTKMRDRVDPQWVQREAGELVRSNVVRLPNFSLRARSFRNDRPRLAASIPVFTDEHAPIERLMRSR